MCTEPNGAAQDADGLCEAGLVYYQDLLRGVAQPDGCPQCLLDLGLVSRLPEGYAPIAPRAALGSRIQRLERSIEQQKLLLETMRGTVFRAERAYLESYHPSDTHLIRVIQGPEAISATLSATVGACQHELLTAQPGGGRPQSLLEKALDDDLSALARGVRQQTIYQHTIRSHAPTLAYAEKITEAGGEIRTVDEVFDRLIICDRRIAFIPDPESPRSDLALAIEHPGVVRYLAGIFLHTWQRAVPLQPTSAGRHSPAVADEMRRAVLRHVINGYTDSAIAARLGMSLRSVTNHVRGASDLYGSRSRAQLAYLLARSGFFEEE